MTMLLWPFNNFVKTNFLNTYYRLIYLWMTISPLLCLKQNLDLMQKKGWNWQPQMYWGNWLIWTEHIPEINKKKLSDFKNSTQEIWHKESLFQQYMFVQSQHQRCRNRGKHSFNTSLLPSSSIYAFKLNNKAMKTSTKTVLLFLCRVVQASMFCWKLLCFDITILFKFGINDYISLELCSL